MRDWQIHSWSRCLSTFDAIGVLRVARNCRGKILCTSHSLTMAVMWKVNGNKALNQNEKHINKSGLYVLCTRITMALCFCVCAPSTSYNRCDVLPAESSNLLNFTEQDVFPLSILVVWPKNERKCDILSFTWAFPIATENERPTVKKNCLQRKLWICCTVILFVCVRISWLFLGHTDQFA